MKRTLIFLALASCFAAMSDVELVVDGEPKADIVIPENALSSVKLAAEDLRDHLEKMSGATLPIVTSPTESVPNHVFVGESERTRKRGVTTDDLKVEGFKIMVKDHHVVLVGHDEQRPRFPYKRRDPESLRKWREFAGENYNIPANAKPGVVFNEELDLWTLDATATLYATSEFLERLGVRWYMPYEDGTVIPKKNTIVVDDMDVKMEPAFPVRKFNYYGHMRVDANGVLWFKRLKYGASKVDSNNHTTWDIIANPEQKEEHPDYYAMSEGKPIPGMANRGVPRLTDPSFRDTSINYLNKVLEAFPWLEGASVGMPDGFVKIDERDAKIWNRSDRGQYGKYSDYVWDYWLDMAKRLKKTHPNKYLATCAYSTYLEPPSQVEKLPDNVAVMMAYTFSRAFMPVEKRLKKVSEKWRSMLPSKKYFSYDWFLFYRDGAPRYPVMFTKILQEEMRDLAGECEGRIFELAPVTRLKDPHRSRIACPGLVHMLIYWQGKLLWDPEADREKLFDEYYDLYFGPAKAEMKEFYEFAEKVWTRPESRSISIASGFLKAEDVDRYFEILKRARAKAGYNTVYDRRIAQIEKEMEPLKILFPNLIKRSGLEFTVYRENNPFVLDGDFNKRFWSFRGQGSWYRMRDLVTGQPIPKLKSTHVSFRMTRDRKHLVIGIKCLEPKMDKIIAKTKARDDFNIFNDDVVEIYIETPKRSYFKIVVNPNGAIWDESQDVTIVDRDTLPTLWNPGVETVINKEKDRWTAEVMIPVKDFGALGPSKEYPWGINVCRTRRASGEVEAFAISPTGKMRFAELTKLGNLQ